MPDSPLTEFHGRPGRVRWKLTADGVFIERTGIQRTDGPPRTVTHAWETYTEAINRWAAEYDVYCQLILATMCTETTANPSTRRNEPGYLSDDATPDKVSPGLMQTLISTARSALRNSGIDSAWLLVPENSIRAGAAYIAQQERVTKLAHSLPARTTRAASTMTTAEPTAGS